MRPTNATTIADRRGPTVTLTLAFLMLLSVLAVSGCNTVSGMGEDISAAGKGIDQTSEATQQRMGHEDRAQQQSQQQRGSDYQAGRY